MANDNIGVSTEELTEEQRRFFITNYFKVTKLELPSFTSGRILLVYAGVFLGLLLMIYLRRAIPTVIFSSACFIFAFWQFYLFIGPYFRTKRLFSQRPSEEQMVSWLIKDLKKTVKPRSITTLGLNMSDVKPENFIIIPVPIFWQAQGLSAEEVLRSPLSDGTYIYTAWRVQILVLTKYYISLFKCNYNWLTDSINTVSTNEFYFQDITSINNDIREIEFSFIDNPEQPIGAGKVFHVTNFSGEHLTVINEIPSLAGPKNIAVNLEYIVSLLRMILRNRRFNIMREEYVEPKQEETPEQIAEAQEKERQENVDAINSIDYLMQNPDSEGTPDSQFGNKTAVSSFEDDIDVEGLSLEDSE